MFDEKKYTPEDSVNYKDETGVKQQKRCPVTNFIRWRYAEDAEDIESEKLKDLCSMNIDKKMSSNARIVNWSDGTSSLAIGDHLFEVQTEAVESTQCFA